MDFKKTSLKNSLLVEYNAMLKTLPSLKKSTKAVYAIGRTLKKLREPAEQYDEDRRKMFAAHFGEASGEVGPKHPSYADFQKELRVLNNLIIEVEYMKFDLTDLNEENELSPAQIEALLWLTEEPEPTVLKQAS